MRVFICFFNSSYESKFLKIWRRKGPRKSELKSSLWSRIFYDFFNVRIVFYIFVVPKTTIRKQESLKLIRRFLHDIFLYFMSNFYDIQNPLGSYVIIGRKYCLSVTFAQRYSCVTLIALECVTLQLLSRQFNNCISWWHSNSFSRST